MPASSRPPPFSLPPPYPFSQRSQRCRDVLHCWERLFWTPDDQVCGFCFLNLSRSDMNSRWEIWWYLLRQKDKPLAGCIWKGHFTLEWKWYYGAECPVSSSCCCCCCFFVCLCFEMLTSSEFQVSVLNCQPVHGQVTPSTVVIFL